MLLNVLGWEGEVAFVGVAIFIDPVGMETNAFPSAPLCRFPLEREHIVRSQNAVMADFSVDMEVGGISSHVNTRDGLTPIGYPVPVLDPN
jgi:hypothetical protein